MIDLEKVLTDETIEDVIYYLDISLNESGGDDRDLQPTRGYIQQFLADREVLLALLQESTGHLEDAGHPCDVGDDCIYMRVTQALERAGRSKP